MKSSISYDVLAKFSFYGFSKYTYSGLKDVLLYKINQSSNQLKISELVKTDGFYNYQEISKILLRLEKLEAIIEDFGNTSGDAIDSISAARFLGVSKRTVDDLTAKNKIDSYHIGSRRLYRPYDLAKYRQNQVEKNKQMPIEPTT